MADILVDQEQQPIYITVGDDVTLPIHFVTKTTITNVDQTTTVEKSDYQLQTGDQIDILLPDNTGASPIVLSTVDGSVTISDAPHGLVSVQISSAKSANLALFTSAKPGTFKGRVTRGGKRSTFVFAGLLVVKADDFNPFS